MALIDLDKAKELKQLIESLTHSGKKDLNKEEMKRLFEFCSEKQYLDEAQNELLFYLQKDHSEVRFSTAQIIHELLTKYDDFREFIIDRLDQYLKWTLAVQATKPIPPPKAAATALRKLTLENFLVWEKSYPHITKISRAIRYLKRVEHMDFETGEIVHPEERRVREEEERLNAILNKGRLNVITAEIEEMMPDISSTMTSLESCFDILMPLQGSSEDDPVPSCSYSGDLREYGIVSSKHSVQIELGIKITIVVDDENSAVVDAAKEAFRLINNKYLPKLKAWEEIINKAKGSPTLMEKATTLKSNLEALVLKYSKLDFVKRVLREEKMSDESEVSSDSDLEEVPEPKPKVKEKIPETPFLADVTGLARKEDKAESAEGSKQDEASGSAMNERKKQLLSVAPKVPYDIDLYHWEDKDLKTPTLLAVNCEGARFWGGGSSEDLMEIPVPDGAAALRTRVIEFSGQWEPVEHTCRAPLPSGKLCPRKDRIKCPFHGLIVERDDEGKIINKDDEEKVAKSKSQNDVPEWQDPKLLAELKAQTGIDLKMPEKGKRIKKKKHPGLTDLKEIKNTSKERISKKIFNKKSVKRVAETLDKIDHNKHRDKFGDQFNYVHGT